VPVSVNAAESAAVVDAAVHILELATRYVFLEVAPAEAEANERNSAHQDCRNRGDENCTCVREHRGKIRRCVSD